MIGFKFGSFNMQNPAAGFTVTGTDIYSAPENRIQADSLAEADGSVITQQQFASKPFTVNGWLRAQTAIELQAMIDTFKGAMSQRNQAFDVDHGGSVRRYLANARNIMIAYRGLTSATFSVEFFSPDGTGWDIVSSIFLAPQVVTSASISFPINNGGSYKAEPTLMAVVSSASGSGTRSITIANGETLRGLTVTRSWAAGDVLEINSQKGTVFVNNAPVDPRGQFPSWAPGAGTLSYNDDFTGRSITVSGTYLKRYL